MQALTDHLQSRADLDKTQIAEATEALLSESVADAEKADFLRALALKGETPGEIAAFVNAFLERAVDPGLDAESVDGPLLDVCGTGGDKLNLFNVSTGSVFILAAAGAKVVKHGNRGITSKSGSSDVLEALGIRIDLPPDRFCDCLRTVGAGFLFAPMYHPAFKAVVGVRGMLAQEGQRTIFNILGPLLNPVRPEYQVVGLFDENLGPVFAKILGKLGRKRAWAVHGKTETGAGMDELSSLGETRICETNSSVQSEFTIQPGTAGIESGATVDDLKGGDAAENAALLRGIFAGEITGPKRDIVCLNAAAGLVVTGLAEDLAPGFLQAGELIDSGGAAAVLDAWAAFE
ncbi:MAG: anthranilate phosphoribosyltransferase [Verrucomicrobiales bacterium]|nr:anthranilate phosphoribosyltransferase [Verrucomicrobiales bacterium]